MDEQSASIPNDNILEDDEFYADLFELAKTWDVPNQTAEPMYQSAVPAYPSAVPTEINEYNDDEFLSDLDKLYGKSTTKRTQPL